MKYRMYIDEVGNSDLGASENPNHRYLSLTGVIIELRYVDRVVSPEMEKLKRKYFTYHVDDPLIFHRKDIVNKRKEYASLRDQMRESDFNKDLLAFLKKTDYTVITVVIDKLELKQRYTAYQYDPYHYALEILLERYVMWLEHKNEKGDVLAESRGKKEDMRLKKSFRRLCDIGTQFIASERLRNRLTSVELKVKSKNNNITGLQIADLIAHPSYRFALSFFSQEQITKVFGQKIVEILKENKYYRKNDGTLEGWGIKLLP